jgi:hypothetical protein
MERKYLVLDGDPKNKPEQGYKYIVDEEEYFVLVYQGLSSKIEFILTKEQILNIADWLKKEF